MEKTFMQYSILIHDKMKTNPVIHSVFSATIYATDKKKREK